jgi:hypothetical protein
MKRCPASGTLFMNKCHPWRRNFGIALVAPGRWPTSAPLARPPNASGLVHLLVKLR